MVAEYTDIVILAADNVFEYAKVCKNEKHTLVVNERPLQCYSRAKSHFQRKTSNDIIHHFNWKFHEWAALMILCVLICIGRLGDEWRHGDLNFGKLDVPVGQCLHQVDGLATAPCQSHNGRIALVVGPIMAVQLGTC